MHRFDRGRRKQRLKSWGDAVSNQSEARAKRSVADKTRPQFAGGVGVQPSVHERDKRRVVVHFVHARTCTLYFNVPIAARAVASRLMIVPIGAPINSAASL